MKNTNSDEAQMSIVTVTRICGALALKYRRHDGEWTLRFLRGGLTAEEAERAADVLRRMPVRQLTRDATKSALAEWI